MCFKSILVWQPSVHVWCITVCHQPFRREAIVYRLPCISKQRASVNSQQILQRCTYLIFVLRDVQIVEKIEFLLSVVVFYLLDLCQIFLFFLYQTGSLLVSLFQFLCQGLCNDKYFLKWFLVHVVGFFNQTKLYQKGLISE